MRHLTLLAAGAGLVLLCACSPKIDVQKDHVGRPGKREPLWVISKLDRKSTRLNSSHSRASRMPSSA